MGQILVLTLSGLSTALLGIATAALLFILAVCPASHQKQFHSFPVAAAVIEILACCVSSTLTFLIFRQTKRSSEHVERSQKQKRSTGLFVLRISLTLIATAVVVASLVWAEREFNKKTLVLIGVRKPAYLLIIWVIWAVGLLSDLLNYVLLLNFRKPHPKRTTERLTIDENAHQMIEASRPGTTSTLQSNPFRSDQELSSPPSLIHSDGTSSRRTSFSTNQRPPSSRRGVLIRQNSYTRQSARSSFDGLSRPSQDEGFDSWDTSAVAPHIRETVLQGKQPTKTTCLEPIPGSRSPSPAKALEGPFYQTSPSESPPASPLPQPPISRPNSPPSTLSGLPNFTAMFPPPMPTARQISTHRTSQTAEYLQRTVNISSSRPGSTVQSVAPPLEDNIHPLFRSMSPTPPPSASANTVVTAAPEAGQLVDERMLKRMRSGSLPSCPSPLVRSHSTDQIRPPKISNVPSLDTFPGKLVGSRPLPIHQRKRSASFQGFDD